MKFLMIKHKKKSNTHSLILREKKDKFDKNYKETYIKKTLSLMIIGLHSSGKSKELKKIWKQRKELYPKVNDFIYLNALDSFSEWYQVNIKELDRVIFLNKQEDEANINIKDQYIKIQNLVDKSKGAILFIDDIDLLRGKKKEIVKDMLKSCKIVISTAKEKKNIDKTIDNILYTKKYQEIHLASIVSYDATNIIFFGAMATMMATGMHELAIGIMGVRYLMGGKKS